MTRRTMADWLAGSHARPEQVRAEWRERGIAVLPIGSAFDAVRLPEQLVHAAVGDRALGQAYTDFALEVHLDGPVIHDGHGRNYYALVPAGTVSAWRSAAGAECLGLGTHLGVPALDVHEYGPTHPVYWAAVGPRPAYCDPASVALLVRIGAARLAEAAEAVQ
ncbi:hypothetical protein OG429_40790 (plasmid) [Streptomyces sp. NBC_00190]|uniref:hypothetical protein n=1 Tax=unclassified Streptomyces TaxID=2593676 RepID=UPI002E2CD301|nr:hypothetical protein [Streptomyces sp. NBC_00190]WSZ45702.1 hypothetical protein OG239_43835 [Streptomyces sp. NBC_00868]